MCAAKARRLRDVWVLPLLPSPLSPSQLYDDCCGMVCSPHISWDLVVEDVLDKEGGAIFLFPGFMSKDRHSGLLS